jgi:hypothetical protein
MSSFHNNLLWANLSNWQDLIYACETFLNPASVSASPTEIKKGNYVWFQDLGAPSIRSHVTLNAIPTE